MNRKTKRWRHMHSASRRAEIWATCCALSETIDVASRARRSKLGFESSQADLGDRLPLSSTDLAKISFRSACLEALRAIDSPAIECIAYGGCHANPRRNGTVKPPGSVGCAVDGSQETAAGVSSAVLLDTGRMRHARDRVQKWTALTPVRTPPIFPAVTCRRNQMAFTRAT